MCIRKVVVCVTQAYFQTAYSWKYVPEEIKRKERAREPGRGRTTVMAF